MLSLTAYGSRDDEENGGGVVLLYVNVVLKVAKKGW